MSFHSPQASRSMAQVHLLMRLGHELARLARDSARLQGTVSLLIEAPHRASEAIRDLQGLDRLTQELEELAGVLTSAAKGVDVAAQFDSETMRGQMKLQDLASALFGPSGPHHSSVAQPGDVALF